MDFVLYGFKSAILRLKEPNTVRIRIENWGRCITFINYVVIL